MRRSVGVITHGFELFKTPLMQGIGNGGTHPGMILMIVGALDFDMPTVQKKALIRRPFDGAYSKGGTVNIDGCPILLELAFHGVEMGVLQIPQQRVGHIQTVDEGSALHRRHTEAPGVFTCYLLSPRIKHHIHKLKFSCFKRLVLHLNSSGQCRLLFSYTRSNKGSVL